MRLQLFRGIILSAILVSSSSIVEAQSLADFRALLADVQARIDKGSGVAAPRLTLRPHEMATGTQTKQAGEVNLPEFPDYTVYVPPQCVGEKRCPLVFAVGGTSEFYPVADKHGTILLTASLYMSPLVLSAVAAQRLPQTDRGTKVSKVVSQDIQTIDSVMALVLRTYAIDPDKIAITGFSNGGDISIILGRANSDVFSRIAALSSVHPYDADGPKNPNTQFLLSGGLPEGLSMPVIKMAQVLRRDGYPVATMMGLRGHERTIVEVDFAFQWFKDSWADPSSTARVITPPDSDVVLTEEGMQQIFKFYTRFTGEPDSARDIYVRVPMALGAEPSSLLLWDIPTMAARYPTIAADLQAAGLTAQQAMALWTAIFRIDITRCAGIVPGIAHDPAQDTLGKSIPFAPIAPNSVLAKNLVFRQTHPDVFKALNDIGITRGQFGGPLFGDYDLRTIDP